MYAEIGGSRLSLPVFARKWLLEIMDRMNILHAGTHVRAHGGIILQSFNPNATCPKSTTLTMRATYGKGGMKTTK